MIRKSQFKNQTNCINFIECPLCYKCRGFNLASIKCQNCEIPKCTRATHTPKNINMMVTRDVVKLEGDVEFINPEGGRECD